MRLYFREVEEDLQTTSIPASEMSSGQSGGKKKIIFSVIFILILFLLVSGTAWFIFKSAGEEPEGSLTSVPEQALVEPAEPTAPQEESTLIREGVRIQVLNGSGITGEAGFLKNELESLGYEEIETGNAPGDNQSVTEVTFTSSVDEGVRKEIIQKLEDLYSEVKTTTASLTNYDIRIIAGLRSGQSLPTGTPTSTPKPTATKSPSSTVSATPTP